MKKTTFTLLYTFASIIVLGAAFLKIMHITYADYFFVSGFILSSIISLIYSYSQARHIKALEVKTGYKIQESEYMKKNIISLLFILSLLAVLVGSYMKTCQLTGAWFVLGTGFVVGFIISSIDNKAKMQRIQELETQLQAKSE